MLVQADVGYNIVLLENSFNGNPAITSVNTNYAILDAAEGLFWGQGYGNWFLARNTITNYSLEAIQLNSAPAAVVGNDFGGFVSGGATCALNGWGSTLPTVTGSVLDRFFSFIGNSVASGRHGELGALYNASEKSYRLNFCGNTISLYPAFNRADDYPGAVVTAKEAEFCNISGNTLVAGGHGVHLLDNCTNAVILKNDFGTATHRAIAYSGTNGVIKNIIVVKNILGQGDSYHLRLPHPDAFNYFLIRNTYKDGASTNNAFLDPAASPVHFSY